ILRAAVLHPGHSHRPAGACPRRRAADAADHRPHLPGLLGQGDDLQHEHRACLACLGPHSPPALVPFAAEGRPMSSIKLTPIEQPSGGVEHVDPLLLPELGKHYSRRADRLRQLASEHPMADYLAFAARIADAQHQVLARRPLPESANARLDTRNGQAPLDPATLSRDAYWRELLAALIDELKPQMPAPAVAVLDGLRDSSAEELENLASALLAGDFATVGSDRAVFLWAALSL